MVSFAMFFAISSFMRNPFLIVDLGACANGVLSRKSSCANDFKAVAHFLFYQVQALISVKVFDLSQAEFRTVC